MIFSNPLGFLALLAIPVIILIYIIKSKYTEQTIPSTYLWTLSERFLKRKNPFKAVTGIISLILQLLAVVFIALAVAKPVFILKGKANDYCFILDASASMNANYDGRTRFDAGKGNISDIIGSSANGSTYTLIVAGDTTEVIYKSIDDKKSAIDQLNALSSSFSSSNLNSALTQAQLYFNANNSMKFYVVTDREFETTQNVNYIGVIGDGVNYALDDVEYGLGKVTGTAVSYTQNATLTVEAFINDGVKAVGSTTLEVQKGVVTDFTVEVGEVEYNSISIRLKEADSLGYDNEVKLYNKRASDDYNTLLVSRMPSLIQAAVEAAGNLSCEVITPEQYTSSKAEGYSLYIFDSDNGAEFSPNELPTDGAVWFINPTKTVKGAGFTYNSVEAGGYSALSTSTERAIKKLLKGTSEINKPTYFVSYVKCNLNGSFYPLMYCNNDPIVFAGTNAHGNREVVFAFDFNDSNFPVSYNGRALINNLINYTFPTIVDETTAYSGETVTLNVLPGCTSLLVTSPSGEEDYLDTSETISEYQVTEVGEYAVTATIGNIRQTAYLYSCYPLEERELNVKQTNFVLSGEADNAGRDGKYEDILYLFIILGVLVIADWAVYCYEQYQLR